LKIVCRCIDDEDRYQGVSFVEVDGSLESVGERRLAECGADVAAVTALNCEDGTYGCEAGFVED